MNWLSLKIIIDFGCEVLGFLLECIWKGDLADEFKTLSLLFAPPSFLTRPSLFIHPAGFTIKTPNILKPQNALCRSFSHSLQIVYFKIKWGKNSGRKEMKWVRVWENKRSQAVMKCACTLFDCLNKLVNFNFNVFFLIGGQMKCKQHKIQHGLHTCVLLHLVWKRSTFW